MIHTMKPLIFAVMTFALFGCDKSSSRDKSFEYGFLMANGVVPYQSVVNGFQEEHPLTNWMVSTNFDGPYPVRIVLLKANHNPAVAVGQVWCVVESFYENNPEISNYPAETNGNCHFPAYSTTNYWPQINGHSEIFRIESLDANYARVRIRMWSDATTAFVDGESLLIPSYIQKNATLIK